MIDKVLLTETVEKALQGSDLFIVDITVGGDNVIEVTVDSPSGVDIEQCVAINRAVEAVFDRDVEDYELTVGSAGVTAPFRVRAQYEMNVGNKVEVLTRDGRKLHATLTAVAPDFTSITVTVPTKVKEEGDKRPRMVDVPTEIPVENIKSIVRELEF